MLYPEIRFRHGRRGGKEGKPSLVELEIYFRRKRKFLSTGVRVFLDEWDDSKMVVNRADAVLLNMKLSAFRRPYDTYVAQLAAAAAPFSFDQMEKSAVGRNGGGMFIDFLEDRIRKRVDIRESTRCTHMKIVKTLHSFGEIISFADLKNENIRAFDEWLHQKYDKQTTIACYHKLLKTYINQAIAMGKIDKSPYVGIKISMGKASMRKFLTTAELAAIEALEPADIPLSKTKDLFLFQCYTGLAFSDLDKFDFSNTREENGKYIIRDERCKSGEVFYMAIFSPAMKILQKYGYKLPKMTNQKYNMALKALAACARLRFNLTSHVGRHTFATWCLNQGIPVEQLAKMLGHADIKTTQIYAKMLDTTLDKVFDFLEEKLVNR